MLRVRGTWLWSDKLKLNSKLNSIPNSIPNSSSTLLDSNSKLDREDTVKYVKRDEMKKKKEGGERARAHTCPTRIPSQAPTTHAPPVTHAARHAARSKNQDHASQTQAQHRASALRA